MRRAARARVVSQAAALLCVLGCEAPEAARTCSDDTVCGVALCLDGACQRPACETRAECPRGACGLDGLCQQSECNAGAACPTGFVCEGGLCRSPRAGTGLDATALYADVEGLRPPPGFRADAATGADAETFFGPLQGRWDLQFALESTSCRGDAADVTSTTTLEASQSGATVRAWLSPDSPGGGLALVGARTGATFTLESVMPQRSAGPCALEQSASIEGRVSAQGALSGRVTWRLAPASDCADAGVCERTEAFAGDR